MNAPVIQPLTIPPAEAPPDTEIIIPPTPTKQLLPFSETDGLTSGAVQPPGSTGEDHTHEHIHVHRDSGEESDGSRTEDEVLRDLVTAEEDEDEGAAIPRGGYGVPIGPVSHMSVLALFSLRCGREALFVVYSPRALRWIRMEPPNHYYRPSRRSILAANVWF